MIRFLKIKMFTQRQNRDMKTYIKFGEQFFLVRDVQDGVATVDDVKAAIAVVSVQDVSHLKLQL